MTITCVTIVTGTALLQLSFELLYDNLCHNFKIVYTQTFVWASVWQFQKSVSFPVSQLVRQKMTFFCYFELTPTIFNLLIVWQLFVLRYQSLLTMDSEVKGLVFRDEDMTKMSIGASTDEGDSRFIIRISLRRVMLVCQIVIGVTFVAATVCVFGDNNKGVLTYECPSSAKMADSVGVSHFEQAYIKSKSQKELNSNMTQFLKTFRTDKFDDWGYTYERYKAHMQPWKQKYYAPNLKSGQSIYESACGIGLNLYMTLEILQDAGITNLVVYGNEYIPVSADKANYIFDHAAPAASKKGMLCAGDSTDLSFVPSNAFDLVFTGYPSPLLDPLGFETGDVDDDYLEYKRLCEASKKKDADWKDIKLLVLAQEKQENFYGKWVAEMVRISKPGAVVIVEQVGYPYCDIAQVGYPYWDERYTDSGGVDQDWWISGIEKYGWDVDPSSVETGEDNLFGARYHVFLRKNR